MRRFFTELSVNFPFVAAVASLLVAQILKLIFHYWRYREVDFRLLVSAGGMPSSHTALVTGLATAVGLKQGWASSAFGVALIFALIVMYDAAGIRRAAGRQARILNMILEDLYQTGRVKGGRLSELIGHTPYEVFWGAVLGVLIALFLFRGGR